MPLPLRCPTCSAPLQVPEPHATTARCAYCGAGVLLTERGGHVEAAAAQERHTDAIAAVLRHLRAGNKIAAIKVYRDRFGVGLKESKEAVERLAAGQPEGTVPRAAGGRGAIGCALVLLALGALVPVLVIRRGMEPEVQAPATEPAARPVLGARSFARRVLQFGSEGTGAGRFDDARIVAVDGAGRIYVGEHSGGRVQVFDSTGAFLTQWMADSRNLEADRGGTVYVAERVRIQLREGATGRVLGEIQRPHPSGSIEDVALALDGTMWLVAGTFGIYHLDRDGTVIREINAREAIGENARPHRVAVAGTGDVYLLDRFAGEVYHLDPNGRFVDRFPGREEGGWPPHDLAIDGRGRVLVSSDGIRVYDPAGRFLGSFGGELVFGIAINDRDEVFATERNRHRIVKYRLRR